MKKASWKQRLARALGSQEDPHQLAAAWACGVAISLSPFLGLHTALALACAFLFRLNKVDVLLGTLLINPWTLPPYWFLASRLGSFLTGWEPTKSFALPHPGQLWQRSFWQQEGAWLWANLGNWLVGAGLLALLGGLATYWALRHLLARRRVRALTG